jgi:hypothetical protein
MRKARIVEVTAAYYHVISRVVGRERLFDTEERERFTKTMRQVEGFCGAAEGGDGGEGEVAVE